MKFIKLIILFCALFISSAYAQKGATNEVEASLIKKGTLLVLNSFPENEFGVGFKDTLSKTLKQYWTFCPVKYVDSKDEMKSLLKIDGNYQLGFNASYEYGNHNIVICKDYNTWDKMIAEFPLPPNYAISFFLIPAVQAMQNDLNLMIEYKMNATQFLKSGNELYEKNLLDLKSKTLYILKDQFTPKSFTTEDVEKIYPYKIKVLTPKEIREAIESQNENVAIVYVSAIWVIVIESNGGKVLLNTAQGKKIGLKEWTIKKITDCIEESKAKNGFK